MTVETFFEKYPNAPGCIKVGDNLYLWHRRGAAVEHARRHSLELEEVPNPAGVGPDDTGDAPVDGPDDTGETAEAKKKPAKRSSKKK